MLLFLKNHQINKNAWDLTLQNSPQAVLYANSWYLDLVCPTWSALIYQKNGKYEAIMPLPTVPKFGFWRIQQPFFSQQLGFFGEDTSLIPLFLDFLNKKFDYIPKYCFNVHNFIEKNNFSAFSNQILQSHHLDLRESYQSIYKNYKADRRYVLRKTQTDQIIESLDIEPLINFFKESTAPKISGGVSEQTYNLLRKIHKVLIEKKAGKIFYTKKDSEITSGILLAFYKNQIIYLFNAAPSQYRHCNGRTYLLDYIFRQYAQKNYIFDFESPQKYPIVDFYKSFGAKTVNFLAISQNKLPFWIEQIRKAKQFCWERLR